ncbi:glycoside hydrolase family 30 protein [Lacibacter sp. H407]|uniref:glycoside hydrolase family 30 protein n=1 Tax=Lacibacter sp. H407 TaxID=3133423 RepID=UPI0030C12722
MTINKIFPFLFLVLLSCKKSENKNTTPVIATLDAAATVLTNENKQVIQGFGCATVFTPPNTTALTSEEFDRLFGSANGQVGLNILRIRIASDDAWRATELNYAKAAIQRGAIILASPWSPPARMKTNNSIISGKLIPDSAAAYAKYLNDFALYMANNGAPLHAVSVQNEPDWDTNYESCVWTGTEMRDFLKNHGAAVTATKLMAPELVNNNQTYINTILADDAAVANLDIFGTHIYGGGIIDNPQIRSKGKQIWMTEHLDTLSTYSSGISTAVEIHDCLTKANFNAYIWWYGKRFYGPIGQDGIVTRRGYIISHFARFIKPGAVRVGMSANSRLDVLLSAYKNGSKKVVVAINVGSYNVKQKITFDGVTAASFVPYVTTSTKNVEQGTAVASANNSFEFTLPPNSVVTFVEQ